MVNNYWKAILQYTIPKKALTIFAGLMADITTPMIKNYLINQFIAYYKVDMKEACEENPINYSCFNDFFIRRLKPEKRPLACADIISPVDGIVSELGTITAGRILQAKGREYTVEQLLSCDKSLSSQFINGRFATLYLAPKDYHRIHMPITAIRRQMIYVPGKLFSVQPATASIIPNLFARNERVIILFDTEVGLMAMVLIGATIVGAIATQWHGDIKRSKSRQLFNYETQPINARTLAQGAELGYFKLGSTVILLLANDVPIDWLKTIGAKDTIQYGHALGQKY
jgi:phosphatidylserine decarboxylase